MAETSSAVAVPITEEALIAERQRFWSGFTTATCAAAAATVFPV